MKMQVVRLLTIVFVGSIAVVVLADKKSAAIAIKLVRMEGKADELVVYPNELTIGKTVSWQKARDTGSNGDAALNRPPMVKVTFQPPNASPFLRGVVSSVSTKYTMFMSDGTPVRATANVTMKAASSARVGKNPCP